VFGHAGIEAFIERARADERVTSMMQRIVLEADASLADLDEPEITVSYAGSTTRSLQATIPLGDPRRPLDDAQLLAKFRSLADDVIGSDAAVTLTHAVSMSKNARMLKRANACSWHATAGEAKSASLDSRLYRVEHIGATRSGADIAAFRVCVDVDRGAAQR
jgi:2-methylcitrate dehydratase PrpD